jgi:hypothetical protein
MHHRFAPPGRLKGILMNHRQTPIRDMGSVQGWLFSRQLATSIYYQVCPCNPKYVAGSLFFPVVDITDIVPFWRQIGRLKKFWSAPLTDPRSRLKSTSTRYLSACEINLYIRLTAIPKFLEAGLSASGNITDRRTLLHNISANPRETRPSIRVRKILLYRSSCLLHRLYILFPQSLLWDAMVDEIPGKDFIQIPLSINIEVRVDIRLPKGLDPVSMMPV